MTVREFFWHRDILIYEIYSFAPLHAKDDIYSFAPLHANDDISSSSVPATTCRTTYMSNVSEQDNMHSNSSSIQGTESITPNEKQTTPP
jgi:hypothetical protein